MRRLFVGIVALGLATAFATPALCDDDRYYGPGHMLTHGHRWGPDHMMGPCSGCNKGGSFVMDSGHYGRGMRGPWESMKPEQREKWEQVWTDYLNDTLELRQQVATKQIELETLWAQPKVDPKQIKKVEKLSDEVAELQAKLWKKRDQYLMQCRQQFKDQDWTCPGGW